MKLDLVIPASGNAKRLLPLSKYFLKPLLPIFDKTILDHILDIQKKIDFNKIYITYNTNKDYFLNSLNIDEIRNSIVFLNDTDDLKSLVGLGLGNVISSLKNIVENDFVFLCSDYIFYDITPLEKLILNYSNKKIGLLLYKVNPVESHQYSCVKWAKDSNKIEKLVSKPFENKAPSNDAVVGYILPNEICHLHNLDKNRNGEYPLSNLINILIDSGFETYFTYTNKIYHITTINDYYNSNMDLLKEYNLDNYIGKNVIIKDNVVIKNSVIYNNSFISDDIINSVILPESKIIQKIENSICFKNEILKIKK